MARRSNSRPKVTEIDPFEDEEDFENSPDSSSEPLKQLLQDLLGRWHWIALGLVLGVLGAFYYLSKAPKLYEATSTLLVKQKGGGSSIIDKGDDSDLDLRSDDALNTIAEGVKNAGLYQEVASLPEILAREDLLPDPVNWFPSWTGRWMGRQEGSEQDGKPTSPVELAKVLQKWTDVSVRRNTRLVDITVTHPVPECAQLLADIIAGEYFESLGKSGSSRRNTTRDSLLKKADEARDILQIKENALANYQQILESLETLKEKELIFSEMDRRYLAMHPKLITAKAILADVQERFLAEFVLIRRAVSDKEYWEGNRAEWDQPNLDSKSLLLIAKRLLTARATVLRSEIESQKGTYDALQTKYNEADADDANTGSEVDLNTLSQLPDKPASPRKMIVLAGSGIFGLGFGFAFAFLLVKLDNKIHTVLQAELLTKLPVLATIRDTDPKILEKIISEKGASQKELSREARKWDPRIVFRPGLTESLYAEMFRILRASISLLGDEKKRKVSLFSSALPGEGKTTISANFAIASALQGRKTIYLDFDLRKPAVHRIFGLKRGETGPGVTGLLAGQVTWQEASTTKTGQKNLTCLFSGARAPNPGELLDADTITDLLEELEKEFDVIVIDSAPLLAVPDTRLLIPLVDNFCLVVRAESTPKGAVRKVVQLVGDDGVDPSGIVINGYEEPAGIGKKYRYGYGGYGQYGKGYGYGSYGSYGSDDDDDS